VQLDDILNQGMSDPHLKMIAEQEKKTALDKFEAEEREKQNLVRQEYLKRLENAGSDKEKERILGEMQRRLGNMEDEMEKERAEQERNLDKILKLR
jgi:hypothetical protein